MKTTKVFYKQLVFAPVDGSNEKVAVFQDKFGGTASVITSWKSVIPGLRYNCCLENNKVTSDKGSFYKMLSCRVWVDDLVVVRKDESVQVMLDEEEVESLTFGPSTSMDIDSLTKDLRGFFVHKTFQLANREDIDSFIGVYKKECDTLYSKVKKQYKGETKKCAD